MMILANTSPFFHKTHKVGRYAGLKQKGKETKLVWNKNLQD